MPCLGCTEPEFPFFELAPGTVFKTQTVMGVDKTGYVKLHRGGQGGIPALGEEDIFVV
jgi:uptake hydrogenase small subunit